MKRITIAGGGLAGLSAGIALAERGVPVTLCEAGSYPRHRVCGEFINGVDQGTLEALGIADILGKSHLLDSTAWFVGDEKEFQAMLPEPAIGVSRHSLDVKLAERFVAKGGELKERTRLAKTDEEGLVWAAGRQADRESGWMGLKVHARDMETVADLEMHLGSAGYVGTARVEGGRVNICGLFRRQKGVKGKGVGLLYEYLRANGLKALEGRMLAGDLDEGSFVGVSAFRLGRQERDGLCRVGDAESIIPPFTGNGMSMAFEAAESALDPLTEFSEGKTEWGETVERLQGRLRERFAKRLMTARVLHPLFFGQFGRLMLASSARSGVLPFEFLFKSLR